MSHSGLRGTKSADPSPSGDIVGETHWVVNGEISIYLWEKYQIDPTAKPVVVLAHGSTTAGRESFDLQVAGKPSYSLMNFLAREGFDVFAPDIRGFGRSTRPAGHINTQMACDDLGAAVKYVTDLRGIEKVFLLGWSWGTQYAGMFIMSRPDRVARYISYGQMHADSLNIALRRSRIEIYRNHVYLATPESDWRQRFYSMTPEAVNDPEVVEAFVRIAAQVETQTPTGPQLDMVQILPMIHARLMPVATMIIHGEYDDVADPDGLLPFFKQLPHADKRYVMVPRAGHMMHLQEGHRRFQYEVSSFLKTDILL